MKMFSRKNYNRYLDDHFDRQYYGAKLKLKKFDTDEFQTIVPSMPNFHHDVSDTGFDSNNHTGNGNNNIWVEVRDLSYHYNVNVPVLKNINLNVPQGKIYALLGASGCGKTTLLRMILGMLKPLTGTIKVAGQVPGAGGESDIPGPGVGYMPQDLALYKSLTIEETLWYYGVLYGIPTEHIAQSVEHYIKLLNLPNKSRLVAALSGGQQRRVSLAVTMIHQPPLLILDEPTVGVDSMLRLRIWNYLEELCRVNGTTVIITTHYTEEARNSYRVGFIDSGLMLAEDNPTRLLYRYNCQSLEDVFLELCLEKARRNSSVVALTSISGGGGVNNNKNNEGNRQYHYQNGQKKPEQQATHLVVPQIVEVPPSEPDDDLTRDGEMEEQMEENLPPPPVDDGRMGSIKDQLAGETHCQVMESKPVVRPMYRKSNNFSVKHLKALLLKNYILFKRNPVSMFLMCAIPMFQLTLFCVSFAGNPRDIPVAVVNNENKSLSNLYLDMVDKKSIKLIHYDNLDDAIESVHRVQSWSVISFPGNFSRNFRKRFTKPERVDELIVKHSNIGMYPDTSHTIFHLYIYQKTLEAFEKFIVQVGTMLGYNPRFFSLPIDVTELVYGRMDIKYSEFYSPGMLIAVIHGMSMLMGSFCVVRERTGGHLERGFVAGIKHSELLMSHILFFLLPILTQVLISLFVMFFIFQTAIQGSLLELFLFCYLASFQGIIFGIVLSIFSPNELASLLLTFSIEVPLIFTSGVLWPIDSLPKTVSNVLRWNPMTLPIVAANDIMFRGWNLARTRLMISLSTTIVYTTVVMTLGFIFFKIKN